MNRAYMLIVKETIPGDDDIVDVNLYATKEAGDKAFDEKVASTADALGLEADGYDADEAQPDPNVRWATLKNEAVCVNISLRAQPIYN